MAIKRDEKRMGELLAEDREIRQKEKAIILPKINKKQ